MDDYNLRMDNISKNELSVLTKIQNLLSNKGSLEILYVLNKIRLNGVKPSDLKDKINLSDGALYPSLTKLIKAGLVEKNNYLRLYNLTEKGRLFCTFLFENDLDSSIKEKKIIECLR